MPSYGLTAILVISMVLQFSAAVMALRLIRLTGERMAWGVITVAILLMTVRRFLTLFLNTPVPLEFYPECVALVISALMLAGVARIGPVFSSIKRSEEAAREAQKELQKARDELEQRVKERTNNLQLTNEELFREITERKQVEGALALEQRRFQALVEDAPFGMMTIGQDGSFRYTNPKFNELFGYDLSEIPNGKEWFTKAFPDPEYRRKVISTWIEDCQNHGSIERSDRIFVVTAKDETDKIILFRLVELGTGEHLVTCEDITERRRSENKLRQTTAHLQALLDASPDIIYFKDLDGRHLISNKGLARFAGLAEEDVLGKTDEQLLPPDLARQCRESDNDVLRRIQIVRAEEILNKNGQRVYFQTVKFPVIDNCGNLVGLGGISRDVTGQKQIEDALQREYDRTQRYLDIAGVMMVALNAEGTVTMINRKGCEILGYEREEIINQNWFNTCIPEEIREQIIADFSELMAGNVAGLEYYENPVLRKDGKQRIVAFYNTVICDESSRITGLLSSGEDVTERRQAEESLRQSEERLERALHGADLGLWDWYVQTGRVVTNQWLAEKLGYSPDETEHDFGFWEGLLHPDDKRRASETLLNRLAGFIDFYEDEYRLGHRTGVWKWILSRGKVIERDSDGKPLRMAGTYLDITDRKRAEHALQKSERRFRAIFDSARDYICLKDRSLRYVQVNPAFETLAGVAASEIIGRSAEDVFGKKASSYITDLDLRVLQGETIEEELGMTIHGLPMKFLATRTPLRESSGEIAGILTVAHDITDRKRIEVSRLRTTEGYPSEAMRLTLSLARVAAKKSSTILLTGESGTGKDHLARYIHDHSDRANGPYFSINCAAIAPELAESELFGHQKGAFTGAVAQKRGLLELAEGGTILLNEIGDFELRLQAKLLTFLDTRKFTRVGGEKEITVNARLIAATNRDMERDIEVGRFRKDLFYRINVMAIKIPPLRERVEDIPVLVQELLAEIRDQMQIAEMPVVAPAVIDALNRHDWPGNVRELRNILERAVIFSHGTTINLADILLSTVEASLPQEEKTSFSASFPSNKSLNQITQELKRFMINEALRKAGGNRQGAAKLLGISRYSLKHYMKKLGCAEEEE